MPTDPLPAVGPSLRDASAGDAPAARAATPAPVDVVLVGCGAVAREFYLPALRGLQRAGRIQVAGLVDPSADALRDLARAFPQARPAAGLESVAAPPGSLAIVASPPRFHASQTIAALARGWHVLCEKPMAANSDEAAEMVAAAGRHERLLAVGLYKRFFPTSRYIRTLCHDRLLGPLASFTIREGGPFRWPAGRSFFDRMQTPGGVLLDIGVHVLDLLDWWLGAPDDFHYADDAMGGLETNAFVELAYAHGTRGTLHLSRDWATAQQYELVFARGRVTWRVNDANGLTLDLAGAPAALRATLVGPPDTGGAPQATNAQSFVAQLENVLAAIAGRESLLVPGDQGVRSLRLIEQCYGRRHFLVQPWLTPREAGAAREFASTPP
jgi:predicted dehydrogenase